MDLRGMEIFARVVEAKSFSEAAERLGVSKSVISKRVTQLEQSIGARLLNRTTRRLSLTEVGIAFYERCAHIIAEANEAELVAARLNSQPCGLLKVSAPVSFGVLHIAPALGEFCALYPELSVELSLNDRAPDLAEDGFDVSICISSAPQSNLVARRLAPIKRQICGSPAYLKRRGIPQHPDELQAHNCLVFTYSALSQVWPLKSAGGDIEIPITGTLRVNNENALRQAALAGLGLALLPTFISGRDLQTGALQSVLRDYAAPQDSVYITYLPSRHLTRKVRAFVDFLAPRLGPIPYWDKQAQGPDGAGDDAMSSTSAP
jgi:DNA-binding transcriptional LysR family regulator